MNDNATVRIGQLCDAAGVQFRSVWSGRLTKDLKPAQPPKPGKRDTGRWTLPQVLAVRMVKLFSTKFGITPEVAFPLTSNLWRSKPSELIAEFRAGRTHAIIIGGKVAGGLFAPSAVDIADRMLKEQGFNGVEVLGVSVEQQWNKIVESLLPDPQTN
jgi:hypothetical protein